MKVELRPFFISIIMIFVLSACGGGGGGSSASENSEGFITLNTSPLHVVGFSDDSTFNPPYPMVDPGTIPDGKTLLVRVFDPFGVGDFYSIKVRNGYGEVANGAPDADESEPDNTPMNANQLTYGIFSNHGLEPVNDEDWFVFTGSSDGECCHIISTTSNMSGDLADPVLEIYDPTPNLGPISYVQTIERETEATIVSGVYDPDNSRSFIAMLSYNAFDQLDKNFFSLIFSGPARPGQYPIEFAAPPLPDDVPNAVSGFINIDQYGEPGEKIIGSFEVTIVDLSRTTTIEGDFEVSRAADEPGLLGGMSRGFALAVDDPGIAQTQIPNKRKNLKTIAGYMKQNL